MSAPNRLDVSAGWIACPTCETKWPINTVACPADGTRLVGSNPGGVIAIDEDDEPIAPGTRVGEFVIESLLGAGGMGEVYGARHPVIDKRVAVKLMNRGCSANPVSVERFVQEAKAVNAIGHPNIVDIFAFGRTDDGRCYFVMEWLRGESLRARLDQGAMDPLRSYEILDTILDALEAAHAAGVVHRDLKPDNIFLVQGRGGNRAREQVKLLDFGIAKLSGDGGLKRGSKTQTGTVVGTPAYMAPEQASGGVIEGPSDIYSLGVMAFEMATGRVPFDAESTVQVMAAHVCIPPPLPSSLRPLAPRFEALVLAMLEKKPADRPVIATLRMELSMLRAEVSRNAALVTVPERSERSEQATAATVVSVITPPAPIALVETATLASTPRLKLRAATDPRKQTTETGRHQTVPGHPGIVAPRRSRAPLVIGALALVAVIVAVVLASRGEPESRTTVRPTPKPTVTPTPAPIPPPPPTAIEIPTPTPTPAVPPIVKKPRTTARSRPAPSAPPTTIPTSPAPPTTPAVPPRSTDVDGVRDPFGQPGGSR